MNHGPILGISWHPPKLKAKSEWVIPFTSFKVRSSPGTGRPLKTAQASPRKGSTRMSALLPAWTTSDTAMAVGRSFAPPQAVPDQDSPRDPKSSRHFSPRDTSHPWNSTNRRWVGGFPCVTLAEGAKDKVRPCGSGTWSVHRRRGVPEASYRVRRQGPVPWIKVSPRTGDPS